MSDFSQPRASPADDWRADAVVDEPGERGAQSEASSPMTAALPLPATQALQVLTIAIGAPGITGVIARVEARLQGG